MARLHEDSDEDFPDLGQLMEQLTTWRNRSQVDAIVVETGQEEMQEGTRQHKNTECQTRQEVGAGEGENETAKRIRRRRPLKTFSKDLSPRPPSPKAAEGLITPPRSRFPNTPYGQSNPSTICSMTSGTYFEEGTQCTSQKGVLNGQHKSTDGIKMPTDGKENLVDGLVRCLKDDDGRIRLSSTSSYDDSGSAFLKLYV